MTPVMGSSLAACVFGTTLNSPILTSAGTSGFGAELSAFGDLRELGAVTVKSLAHFEHHGNPGPRVWPVHGAMLNAVGLPGPGIERWKREYLPALRSSRAIIVVSIWGRSNDDYARAASELAAVAEDLTALEINVSCPNTERAGEMFGHDPEMTGRVVRSVVKEIDLALSVKLSPNTDRYLDVAQAALSGGARTLVVANTYLAQALNPRTGRGVLGSAIGGGLSGRSIFPLTLRMVQEVRERFPEVEIIGSGGVNGVQSVLDLLRCGADAVSVGTLNFVDPRLVFAIARELRSYADRSNVASVAELQASFQQAHGCD
ncbi:MAG: tRNA-dihydrouridine synthase [Acidimicrobiales bacterium]